MPRTGATGVTPAAPAPSAPVALKVAGQASPPCDETRAGWRRLQLRRGSGGEVWPRGCCSLSLSQRMRWLRFFSRHLALVARMTERGRTGKKEEGARRRSSSLIGEDGRAATRWGRFGHTTRAWLSHTADGALGRCPASPAARRPSLNGEERCGARLVAVRRRPSSWLAPFSWARLSSLRPWTSQPSWLEPSSSARRRPLRRGAAGRRPASGPRGPRPWAGWR